jgi:hypothetical protein
MDVRFIWTVNPYPANVDKMLGSYHARKWRMEFDSAFKGLNVTAKIVNTKSQADNKGYNGQTTAHSKNLCYKGNTEFIIW